MPLSSKFPTENQLIDESANTTEPKNVSF